MMGEKHQADKTEKDEPPPDRGTIAKKQVSGKGKLFFKKLPPLVERGLSISLAAAVATGGFKSFANEILNMVERLVQQPQGEEAAELREAHERTLETAQETERTYRAMLYTFLGLDENLRPLELENTNQYVLSPYFLKNFSSAINFFRSSLQGEWRERADSLYESIFSIYVASAEFQNVYAQYLLSGGDPIQGESPQERWQKLSQLTVSLLRLGRAIDSVVDKFVAEYNKGAEKKISKKMALELKRKLLERALAPYTTPQRARALALYVFQGNPEKAEGLSAAERRKISRILRIKSANQRTLSLTHYLMGFRDTESNLSSRKALFDAYYELFNDYEGLLPMLQLTWPAQVEMVHILVNWHHEEAGGMSLREFNKLSLEEKKRYLKEILNALSPEDLTSFFVLAGDFSAFPPELQREAISHLALVVLSKYESLDVRRTIVAAVLNNVLYYYNYNSPHFARNYLSKVSSDLATTTYNILDAKRQFINENSNYDFYLEAPQDKPDFVRISIPRLELTLLIPKTVFSPAYGNLYSANALIAPEELGGVVPPTFDDLVSRIRARMVNLRISGGALLSFLRSYYPPMHLLMIRDLPRAGPLAITRQNLEGEFIYGGAGQRTEVETEEGERTSHAQRTNLKTASVKYGSEGNLSNLQATGTLTQVQTTQETSSSKPTDLGKPETSESRGESNRYVVEGNVYYDNTNRTANWEVRVNARQAGEESRSTIVSRKPKRAVNEQTGEEEVVVEETRTGVEESRAEFTLDSMLRVVVPNSVEAAIFFEDISYRYGESSLKGEGGREQVRFKARIFVRTADGRFAEAGAMYLTEEEAQRFVDLLNSQGIGYVQDNARGARTLRLRGQIRDDKTFSGISIADLDGFVIGLEDKYLTASVLTGALQTEQGWAFMGGYQHVQGTNRGGGFFGVGYIPPGNQAIHVGALYGFRRGLRTATGSTQTVVLERGGITYSGISLGGKNSATRVKAFLGVYREVVESVERREQNRGSTEGALTFETYNPSLLRSIRSLGFSGFYYSTVRDYYDEQSSKVLQEVITQKGISAGFLARQQQSFLTLKSAAIEWIARESPGFYYALLRGHISSTEWLGEQQTTYVNYDIYDDSRLLTAFEATEVSTYIEWSKEPGQEFSTLFTGGTVGFLDRNSKKGEEGTHTGFVGYKGFGPESLFNSVEVFLSYLGGRAFSVEFQGGKASLSRSEGALEVKMVGGNLAIGGNVEVRWIDGDGKTRRAVGWLGYVTRPDGSGQWVFMISGGFELRNNRWVRIARANMGNFNIIAGNMALRALTGAASEFGRKVQNIQAALGFRRPSHILAGYVSEEGGISTWNVITETEAWVIAAVASRTDRRTPTRGEGKGVAVTVSYQVDRREISIASNGVIRVSGETNSISGIGSYAVYGEESDERFVTKVAASLALEFAKTWYERSPVAQESIGMRLKVGASRVETQRSIRWVLDFLFKFTIARYGIESEW